MSDRWLLDDIAYAIQHGLNGVRGEIEKIRSQIESTARNAAKNSAQKLELTAILNRPQSEIDRDSARASSDDQRSRRAEGRDSVRLFVEILALAAGGVVAIANVFLWIQTKEATRIAVISAKAAQKGAEASVAQADATKTSIDETVRAFQLDQRAWVAPIEIGPPPFVVDGKRVFVQAGQKSTFGVIISNTGKTPATRIHTKSNLKAMESSAKFFADYPPSSENPPNSSSELTPGMKLVMQSFPTGVPLTDDHVRGLSEGSHILYFYGEITYYDVFDHQHATHFCLQMVHTLDQLVTCPTYNDIN